MALFGNSMIGHIDKRPQTFGKLALLLRLASDNRTTLDFEKVLGLKRQLAPGILVLGRSAPLVNYLHGRAIVLSLIGAGYIELQAQERRFSTYIVICGVLECSVMDSIVGYKHQSIASGIDRTDGDARREGVDSTTKSAIGSEPIDHLATLANEMAVGRSLVDKNESNNLVGGVEQRSGDGSACDHRRPQSTIVHLDTRTDSQRTRRSSVLIGSKAEALESNSVLHNEKVN